MRRHWTTTIAHGITLAVGLTIGLVYAEVNPAALHPSADDGKGECAFAAGPSHEIVCTPTDAQQMRLELAQAHAQTAKVLYDEAKLQEQVAQKEFQARLNDLDAVATAVRTENKWAATVTMSVDTLRFTDTKGAPTHEGEGKGAAKGAAGATTPAPATPPATPAKGAKKP